MYEEIGRLGEQLSDARERAKTALLVRLALKHQVLLAFDSRLITLADLERRLRGATDHEVVLATGSDASGRRRVRQAAARHASTHKMIALCSDSMTEGLNLQRASAIVHLDMPSVIRTAEQRAAKRKFVYSAYCAFPMLTGLIHKDGPDGRR